MSSLTLSASSTSSATLSHSETTRNTFLKNGWKEIPGSRLNMVRKDGFRLEIDYSASPYNMAYGKQDELLVAHE